MPDDFLTRSVTAEDVTRVSNGSVLNLIVPYYQGYDRIALPPQPPPYWTYQRDAILRATVHHEAMWAGAIGIAITKLAAMSFNIVSKKSRIAKEAQDILLAADGERVGWVGFISKTLRDYLTTDNGAMIEVVRATKSPGSKVIGLRHLDSIRCLDRDTRITMADGKTVAIVDLVNNKSQEFVLSLDENGELVPKKIIGWHKTKLDSRYWMRVELAGMPASSQGSARLILTNDHPVLTNHGWLRADELTYSDGVVTDYAAPSDEQHAVLVGTMLGDGSIPETIRNGVVTTHWLSLAHSEKYREWLDLKVSALENFGWLPESRGITAIQIKSKRNPVWSEWRNAWYRDGEKSLAREHIESVSKENIPLMLATWFMDDGLSRKDKRNGSVSVEFCTHNYSKEDVEWLSGYLSANGFQNTVAVIKPSSLWAKKESYRVIRMYGGTAISLLKIISPYISPVMRYKLRSIDGLDEFDPKIWELPKNTRYVADIVSISRDRNKEQTATYCIDVEDTHNFIASHMVVHNCTRTGDPKIPCIYRDRGGRLHEMKDYQVIMFSDMPDPSETYYGVGLSAASRAYSAIYKLASIEWYLREKVSGLHPLAIHIVNGVLDQQLRGAVEAAKQEQVSRGLVAYMGAVIIGIPSEQQPQVATIPLAELPDRFERQGEFDIAVLTYANAIGLDPQDLKPLSSSAIGSGAQSQVLADKGSGKGLVAFKQAFTQAMNHYVLPDGVTFEWVEKDYRDIAQKAAISKQYIDASAARITAQITSPQQELQILIDLDELPKEFSPMPHTPNENLSDTEDPEDDMDNIPVAAEDQAALMGGVQPTQPQIDPATGQPVQAAPVAQPGTAQNPMVPSVQSPQAQQPVIDPATGQPEIDPVTGKPKEPQPMVDNPQIPEAVPQFLPAPKKVKPTLDQLGNKMSPAFQEEPEPVPVPNPFALKQPIPPQLAGQKPQIDPATGKPIVPPQPGDIPVAPPKDPEIAQLSSEIKRLSELVAKLVGEPLQPEGGTGDDDMVNGVLEDRRGQQAAPVDNAAPQEVGDDTMVNDVLTQRKTGKVAEPGQPTAAPKPDAVGDDSIVGDVLAGRKKPTKQPQKAPTPPKTKTKEEGDQEAIDHLMAALQPAMTLANQIRISTAIKDGIENGGQKE